jgi:type IX secretion system substrate protein
MPFMINLKTPTFILAILIFTINISQGQITVNQADLPSVGDTVRVSNGVINPLLDISTTGTASNWDFSALQWVTQDVDTFVSVSSTGIVYSVVFVDIFLNPNRANLAEINLLAPTVPLVTIEEAVGFFYKTSSVFEQAGYGAALNTIPTAVTFDNRDVIYNLPLNYSDTDSSNSNYSVSIPTVGFYAHEQKRVNTVDGWGSITTPYGTFDALRVKSVITGRDSVFASASGIGFGFDIPVTVEYKWLGIQKKLPILQITTTENFGFEVINSVVYLDSLRNTSTAIPEFSKNVSVYVYPNPAKNTAHLSINSDINTRAKIIITTIDGRLAVKPESILITKGTNYISLDAMINNLSAGYYTVVLQSNNGLVKKKLIIAK